ncbi:MAG: hypothetical protein Unbinned2990contig1001_37 [Prokaryotic dsDNA virus sp.]|nr:MAG: hypothetical protein Unbinned2990contig1001_37 [Prokaryotic dsDNA virus sp.]|tara:strand:+ start:16462 stop:16800 length:339 start_codon:yes stop_codon:yes gene_type:complete
MSLSKNKYITYNNLDDVYNELDALYDIAIEKGFDLGEALYSQALHFVDLCYLINEEIQDFIKKYQFCKMFNALPYKSYEDTPKEIVDLFIMINKEIEANQASKIKKNNKGNN